MSILIIGGKGNMGRRYRSILSYLGKDTCVSDIDTPPKESWRMAERSDGIIIASPTDTHTGFILSLAKLGKPILCEKPISKDVKELAKVLRYTRNKCPIAMVYQYGMIADTKGKGLTHYDYYHHGSDGLFWDCIQLIGLANGDLKLSETSHIWRCQINGTRINRGQMDYAYEAFISAWLRNPRQDVESLIDLHVCTSELEQDALRADGRNH